MNLSPHAKNTLLLLLLLILAGCAPTPAEPTQTAITPTPLPPTATAAPTEIPTPKLTPTPTTIYLTAKDENANSSQERSTNLPNPWTDISIGKYTVFPRQDIPTVWFDYAYDKRNGLWIAGSFGVLHKDLDGNHTWYPFNDTYPRPYFTRIAVSPSGEVWVTGKENLLFRFDGEQWIDEGKNLPLPSDDFVKWLCVSDTISGIDFGPDGKTWVMNGGIELYYQNNGHWERFPFPKDILPWAGGGNCPIGLRVISKSDIDIKLSGG